MANAIRLLCADRGLDYRRFDLIAFGGAGPLHAAALARRVGLERVLVPPSPGVASAFGALAADLRVDRRLTRVLRSDTATDAELRGAVSRIATEALDELRAEGGDPPTRRSWSRRAAATSARTSSRRSPCRSTPADDLVAGRCVERFHASTRPLRLPHRRTPWSSWCMSTRSPSSGAPPMPAGQAVAGRGRADHGDATRLLQGRAAGCRRRSTAAATCGRASL